MSLLDNLPHRCTIRKRIRTRTAAGLGGNTDSYTTISTGVHCWSQAATQTDIEEFEKIGMVINQKVYFASDPSITEQHEIIITSYDGGTTSIASASQIPLEVRTKSVPDASAGMRKLWKVFAEERTGREDSV